MKSAHCPTRSKPASPFLPASRVRNLDFVLTSGGAHVEGTVEQDQLPVAGVQVVLVPDGARRAQPSYFRRTLTDNQGRFTGRLQTFCLASDGARRLSRPGVSAAIRRPRQSRKSERRRKHERAA
jgi:hypothetical protein